MIGTNTKRSKYPLFFHQLLEYTLPGGRDHASLTEANDQMQKVAAHVNEFHRDADSMNRVLEIQKDVHGLVRCPPILSCSSQSNVLMFLNSHSLWLHRAESSFSSKPQLLKLWRNLTGAHETCIYLVVS